MVYNLSISGYISYTNKTVVNINDKISVQTFLSLGLPRVTLKKKFSPKYGKIIACSCSENVKKEMYVSPDNVLASIVP